MSDKRNIAGNTKAAELYGYAFEYKQRRFKNTEMYHVRMCTSYKEKIGEDYISRETVEVRIFSPKDYKAKFIEQFYDAGRTKSRENHRWAARYKKIDGSKGIDLVFDPTLYKEEPVAPKVIEFKTKSSVTAAKSKVLIQYCEDNFDKEMYMEDGDLISGKSMKELIIANLGLDNKSE